MAKQRRTQSDASDTRASNLRSRAPGRAPTQATGLDPESAKRARGRTPDVNVDDGDEAVVDVIDTDGEDSGDEVERGEADGDADVDAGDADADRDGLDDDALEAEVVEEESDEEVAKFELPAKGGTASLARYDALQAYMRDVHRYNVLDAESQRELAIRYREAGDVDAARKLVTSNLRLVVKIAYDYRRAYRNVMDLIQEGNIGLMQAVKKYDPYKGVKLSSYAAWWIRAYILRFILNNWRLVKIGTTQAQRKLFFNLSKEKARLEALGIDPTPENIAERLDVTVEDVTSMDRRLAAGDMSLDTPVGGDESKSQSRVDMMPALGRRVDELLADEELGQMLHTELTSFGETLKDKERRIFYERLMAEDPRTLQELGTDFGVSRERVRQLEKRLQEKLKKYIEERLGSEVFAQ